MQNRRLAFSLTVALAVFSTPGLAQEVRYVGRTAAAKPVNTASTGNSWFSKHFLDQSVDRKYGQLSRSLRQSVGQEKEQLIRLTSLASNRKVCRRRHELGSCFEQYCLASKMIQNFNGKELVSAGAQEELALIKAVLSNARISCSSELNKPSSVVAPISDYEKTVDRLMDINNIVLAGTAGKNHAFPPVMRGAAEGQ